MKHPLDTAVRLIFALVLGILSLTAQPVRPQPLPFTGTNLSGGEFGVVQPGKAPVYGKDFTYPNETEIGLLCLQRNERHPPPVPLGGPSARAERRRLFPPKNSGSKTW